MTPIQAVRHAWAAVREAADSGSREVDDEQLDSIEPGIRLLELSAAYRAAHAAYSEALATSQAAFAKRPIVSATTWRRLEDEQKAAESAMNAAREALLSAALAVGPRATDDADRDP